MMKILNMFFRALIVSLALCMLMCSVSLAEEGFTFTLNGSGDGYIVSGYTGSDAEVKVPAWHEQLPVTEIGSSAFEGNAAITSVSLPSSITRIGKAAFKNCTKLAKVGSYTAESEPPLPTRVPGDVTGDLVADYNDALLIMQYSAGWNVSLDTANADVDGSGSVNVSDAVLILRYEAGENVTLK